MTLRTVAWRNCIPNDKATLPTTQLTFRSRYRYVIGSGAVASIRVVFNNFYFTGASGETDIANAVVIDKVSIERGSSYAPVLFSGVRSKTLAAGDVNIQSDDLLASAFSLASFPRDDVLWIRCQGHVNSANDQVPTGRYSGNAEFNGQFSVRYDPATVTLIGEVDETGAMAVSGGTDWDLMNTGFSPLMLGTFVSGNPKTYIWLGDSIPHAGNQPGFIQRATIDADLATNAFAGIEMAQGGAAQADLLTPNTRAHNFLQYARIAVDSIGTNDRDDQQGVKDLWAVYRAHGIEKIVRCHLLPSCDSTDQYLTEANQTVRTAGQRTFNDFVDAQYALGNVEYRYQANTVRGANIDKWKVDGVTVNLYTIDGGHPTYPFAQTELGTELRTLLSSIRLDAVLVEQPARGNAGGFRTSWEKARPRKTREDFLRSRGEFEVEITADELMEMVAARHLDNDVDEMIDALRSEFRKRYMRWREEYIGKAIEARLRLEQETPDAWKRRRVEERDAWMQRRAKQERKKP